MACKTRGVRPDGPADEPRLRVAVDATPLLSMRTGVRVFCEEALAALGSRPELDVTAYAVTWRRRERILPLLPAGVAAVQRPMPARPLHRIWYRHDAPAIEWFIGPAAVVHGTNFVVPPTRRAARVVTVHDLTPLHFPELCDDFTPTFMHMLRRAISGGAWVHAPSRFVADEVIEAFSIDPGRVRAIHHGIPGEQPTGGGPPLQLPPGTTRYIVAVGTVEPRKDFPGLVRAFDRLAAEDTALVLVGGDGWGMEALDEAVQASHRRQRIVRLGYVDEETRLRVTGGAAVLAFPSVYEGFGFPPLEAMRLGVPVVATAVGAIPEVAGDGALLVAPGDPDVLAEALTAALDDDSVRAGLIERGRARASIFTWEACAAGLAHLYADAARS